MSQNDFNPASGAQPVDFETVQIQINDTLIANLNEDHPSVVAYAIQPFLNELPVHERFEHAFMIHSSSKILVSIKPPEYFEVFSAEILLNNVGSAVCLADTLEGGIEGLFESTRLLDAHIKERAGQETIEGAVSVLAGTCFDLDPTALDRLQLEVSTLSFGHVFKNRVLIEAARTAGAGLEDAAILGNAMGQEEKMRLLGVALEAFVKESNDPQRISLFAKELADRNPPLKDEIFDQVAELVQTILGDDYSQTIRAQLESTVKGPLAESIVHYSV